MPNRNLKSTTHFHHWHEGNLPSNSKCVVCKKTCWTSECLAGMKCEWCGTTAHIYCQKLVNAECNFGSLRDIIIPPYAISVPRIDMNKEAILGIQSTRCKRKLPNFIIEFSSVLLIIFPIYLLCFKWEAIRVNGQQHRTCKSSNSIRHQTLPCSCSTIWIKTMKQKWQTKQAQHRCSHRHHLRSTTASMRIAAMRLVLIRWTLHNFQTHPIRMRLCWVHPRRRRRRKIDNQMTKKTQKAINLFVQ